MSIRSTRTGRTLLAAALVLAAGANAALAQCPSESVTPSKPFTFHWAVKNQPQFMQQTGIDWESRLVLGDAPFAKDTVFLYHYEAGKYPQAGPHILKMNPEWMATHLAKLRKDIERKIPDPDFSGLVVIDYESWHPIWDVAQNQSSTDGPEAEDEDFQDDWREYVRATHPGFASLSPTEQEQYLRETYNQVGREFYETTILEAKKVRPLAKFGYYGRPGGVWQSRFLPEGTLGYGDHASGLNAQANDQMSWLYDAVDIVVPEIFARRVAVPDGQKPKNWRQETDDETMWAWNLNILEEAKRMADPRGKAVYACITNRYLTGAKQPSRRQMCNEINMMQAMRAPVAAGCDGIILWETMRTEQRFQDLQMMLDQSIIPEAKRLAAMCPAPKNTSVAARLPNGKTVTINTTKSKSGAPSKKGKATAITSGENLKSPDDN